MTAVAGANAGTITRTAGFEQSDSRGSFKLAVAADPASPAARNILVYQGSKVYGAPFTSETLAENKSYNTVYQLGEYVLTPYPGILPGVFTVADPDGIANSGDETKVHFSQGNLWANTSGSTPVYNFETNQYDVQSSWSTSHVSLFYWSKTASVAYNQTYSDDDAAANDVFFTNDTEETANADFTVNGVTGKYRNLSESEWQYLFSYDGTEGGELLEGTDYCNDIRKDKYKCGVTVCGKANSVVLLPDEWDASVISLEDFATTTEYNEETTTVKWSAMEAAGAVCLPAAGARNSSEVSKVSVEGNYWSSSPSSEDARHIDFGSIVYFDADERLNGYSVRLVTDVPAE